MKADTFKKGAIGGLMALTLMSAVPYAPRAEAATLQELQAQIQVLLAQLAILQGQANNNFTCAAFTTDLTIARTGSEVTNLQKFLISKGHGIPAGATGYFGEQTRAALAQYQSANAITPAVGYFGPITRAKVNAQCTVVVNPGTPGGGTTNPGDTTPDALSGEGTMENFRLLEGEDTRLEEGDDNVSVIDITFDVEDGDVKINRIDLAFMPAGGNDEKDPWDVFSEVSIWDGTTRIARIDASNDRNWRENNPSGDSAMLRFSGLNYVLEAGTEAELTVKVNTENNIRGIANGEAWEIFVPNNGIRALDASNVSAYTGDSSERIMIDIEEAGTVDELIVKRSDDDVTATTLQLDDSARSGYMTIFAFDLDTDDSPRDIEIRKLPIALTVGTSTVDTFVRDVRLVIDGKTYTKKTVTDGTTNTIVFEFSRGELVIDAGDNVTVEVEVEFKPLDEAYEGTTIAASVVSDAIAAKGADDLKGSQLQGTVSGDTHTLYTKGIIVAVGDKENQVTSVQGALNDYATYTVELDVTAFGQDVYIPKNVADAIAYQLEDANGSALGSAGTAILSSTARDSGAYYRIAEGDTKTVTLEVTYQPNAALTSARLQLLSLAFNATAAPATQTWNAVPATSFETSTRTIVD